MNGSKVCYHHGAKSRKGVEHPNYKHGQYSRFTLPPKLAATMSRIAESGDILNGSDRILLFSARQAEVLESLGSAKTESDVTRVWEQALAVDVQLDRVIGREIGRLVSMHELLPAEQVVSHMLRLIDACKTAILKTPKLNREEQNSLIVEIARIFKASLGDRMPSDLLTSGNGR